MEAIDSKLDNAQSTSNEKNDEVQHPSLQYMDSLIQESLQVYELENQRINTLDELVNSLKIITKFLGFSVDIPHNLLHLDNDTKISLLPNLNLIIIDKNSKTEEKQIDSFSTELIINILDYVVPSIVELVRQKKLTLLNSISFLRSANNGLQKMENIGKLELNQEPMV